MNQTRPHLHMFSKKIGIALSLHYLFVAANSIVRIFFNFWSNKICVNPIGVVSSLSPPWCLFSSDQCCHVAAPCHISFPYSKNEFVASALSSGNASSRRLLFRVKTKALNLHHHHRRPPSLDHRLSPSTTIKMSSQPWSLSSSLNRVSILPPP
jgi:hypothetical protein